MKLVSMEQMRLLDRRMIEDYDTPGEVLMEWAGLGVADVLQHMTEIVGFNNPFIRLIAGRGNNGGDAFAAARQLKEWGYGAEVWLAGLTSDIHGDALTHLSRARAAGVSLRELPSRQDWDHAAADLSTADILVDGILGTGLAGPARGAAVGAIQYINSRARDGLVLAIDIPSGLNADTGLADGEAVFADVTVTMGLPKLGFVEPCALEYVGCIEVVDLGMPEELIAEVVPDHDKELIHLSDLRGLFPRRPRASHKGDYGHVLMMGGARGYSGAITMAARAAGRSGAGLVTVVVPASIAPIVAIGAPEAMVMPAPETEIGSLSSEAWNAWSSQMDRFSAILLGPGLTRHEQSLALVRSVIRDCRTPLVLDADALSVIEGQPHWIEKASCPVVITPHPGEMAKLFVQRIDHVQKDRIGMALAAAKYTRATVVLKGAGTVVAAEGQPACINLTGNPGMATAGSGDVLAGILAGLLGQGIKPFDAARAAVYLHGRAGDLASWRRSQAGMLAGDLIDELPYAFRDVSMR